MAHEVFLSYAAQDKAVADAVCATLESGGIRCWIAPRDIRYGEQWAGAINNAIKSSRVMILIFSKDSNQSKQVANELTLAVNSEVVVIPFKIDDIAPGGLVEYYLAGTHWLDAMNPPTTQQIKNLELTVKQNLEAGQEREASAGQPPIDVMQKVVARSGLRPDQVSHSPVRKKRSLFSIVAVAMVIVFAGAIYVLFMQPADRAADHYSSVPDGRLVTVTSTADSGEGTLREALLRAIPGDVILFDPLVFPPDNPVTIYLKEQLPDLMRGGVTIDASNAGVIIDGTDVPSTYSVWSGGLNISSNNNVIMGLHIVNFFEYSCGISISRGTNNAIGGDKNAGDGPLGQGNLIGNVSTGIALQGNDTSSNLVAGNIIGLDHNRQPAETVIAVGILAGSSNNTVGPGNIILYSENCGVQVWGSESNNNTITRNSITMNGWKGIELWEGGNQNLQVPLINEVDFEKGTVEGTATPGGIVEIFSDRWNQGRTYEGDTIAGNDGNFMVRLGRPLEGPNITATVTDTSGNTSEFSEPFSP